MKIEATVSQLKLGGEKFILLSVNVGSHQKNMVPDFFPKKEVVADVDRRISEMVKKQDPCFRNIPNTSPIDFINVLAENGYKICDPHCVENYKGGLSVRVVLKPDDDQDAVEVELTDEATHFFSCICFLWGHDNRETHSENICLNFNSPRGGETKNHPDMEDGVLFL